MIFTDNYEIMAILQNPEWKREAVNYIRTQIDTATQDQVCFDGGCLSFAVTDNIPLSRLYGIRIRVIRISFMGLTKYHSEAGYQACIQLATKINRYMKAEPAYYNLRIPAEIPDLLRAVNEKIERMVFCGGTVAYAGNEGCIGTCSTEGTCCFLADRRYLDSHRAELEKIAKDSFREYSGQYHIAPRLQSKAGEIYENWVDSIFDHKNDLLMQCSEVEGMLAGFALLSESEHCIDMELTAVDEKMRGRGIYLEMIHQNQILASDRKKIFISSTQLDNYGSQKTWGKLGMRPYYTIYNLHIDYAENKV